jgi:tRNA 5-methylaminomethyl-2-thiouridine biosynthesis bifunctional protein
MILIFDDVAAGLTHIEPDVDAWFLDGFAPARNPAMWSMEVIARIAAATAVDGTFSTFTAASDVRRLLQTHGFQVQKAPGFGNKREMLYGRKLEPLHPG